MTTLLPYVYSLYNLTYYYIPDSHTTQAEFRSIPAMVVIKSDDTSSGSDFPWYAIVIPIVVGAIIIIIVGVVLYFVS